MQPELYFKWVTKQMTIKIIHFIVYNLMFSFTN